MSPFLARISTGVLILSATLAAAVRAQPAFQVAVDEINAAGGVFIPGDPAEPGVDIEVFGALNRVSPPPGSYPFDGFDVALTSEVEIPAGVFDWGATAEAFAAPAGLGVISGAGAFVIDGDNGADLRVRWTLGASNDSPGPTPPLINGSATTTVQANARIRLTDLVPFANYRVTWSWEANGAATSATGYFNCQSYVNLSMLFDGAPVTEVGNPMLNQSLFVPNQASMEFVDQDDGAFIFMATPGFTCDREMLITVVASAAAQSSGGPFAEEGLSTASTQGEVLLHLEKISVSSWERQGDVNCDGDVNGLDIQPFMMLLFAPEQYDSIFPCCPHANADLNFDEAVTVEDISLFTAALLAG